MKKMLLLGGSHAEIPLIKAAKALGYYVITSGNQKDGIGHAYGDEYIACDFSDKQAVLALAEEQQVAAVCSGCNDFAALTTAYVCEKRGLRGHDSYETSLRLHHKDQYRKLAEELHIAAPKAIPCHHLEQMQQACRQMRFPVIVKPVDLTGGKGIRQCKESNDIPNAYHDALAMTRETYVMVEEFIVGTNHGFSAFLQDGRITFYFVDNEQYYRNPYLVSGASAPGDVPETAVCQLCMDSEKIAKNLGLVDGILHIQFILQENGKPIIIEICRRTPGDLYIELVQRATGFDYARYITAAEAGIRLPAPVYHSVEGYHVRHCVMADEPGYIDRVAIAEEIKPYITREWYWYQPGDCIDDIGRYKAGIIFLHFPDEMAYRNNIGKLTDLITIIMR